MPEESHSTVWLPTDAAAEQQAHNGLQPAAHSDVVWTQSDQPPSNDGGVMHKLSRKFEHLDRSIRSESHATLEIFRLSSHVTSDLHDTQLYPELEQDASVTASAAIPAEEEAFRAARQKFILTSGALHKFLELPETEEVHVDDIPEIHLGGSGGGYRACLGFLSLVSVAQECGLWELVWYIAGVSGSCWSIASLYTFAHLTASDILVNLAKGSTHHPLSAAAINSVASTARGVYFQLAPLWAKLKRGHVHPGPLDLYGTLTTTHLLSTPGVKGLVDAENEKDEGEGGLKKEWFKFSRCAETMRLDEGRNPLPILTAVRHERTWKDWKSPSSPPQELDEPAAWYQCFTFTPFDFGCDSLPFFIPTWSFGRHFSRSRSTERTPELSLSLILGLCTSAPAAPLSAYLGTLYRNLPTGAFGDHMRTWCDSWSASHEHDKTRLENHHPVHAQNEPNPLFQSEASKETDENWRGLNNSPRLHLMDAGMANNEPHPVFFRPGRLPDVVLLGDYSSDVQKDTAVERIGAGLVERRLGVRPRPTAPTAEKNQADPIADNSITARFAHKYAQVLDSFPLPAPPSSRNVPAATSTPTLIYLPLLPHAVQPTYDPSTADFSSSYNLVWTNHQVETLRTTAEANIRSALPTIRTVIRQAYERKKAARLASLQHTQ